MLCDLDSTDVPLLLFFFFLLLLSVFFLIHNHIANREAPKQETYTYILLANLGDVMDKNFVNVYGVCQMFCVSNIFSLYVCVCE